jgi:hypothetical protein
MVFMGFVSLGWLLENLLHGLKPVKGKALYVGAEAPTF